MDDPLGLPDVSVRVPALSIRRETPIGIIIVMVLTADLPSERLDASCFRSSHDLRRGNRSHE
jgi:hypothetical protein